MKTPKRDHVGSRYSNDLKVSCFHFRASRHLVLRAPHLVWRKISD